jgi:translocator protein
VRSVDISSSIGLLASLALVAAVVGVGGRFMPGQWYAQLAKPSWTPPNWLFGPAWTLLYILMAVSAWLVWRSAGLRSVWMPLCVYILQLILNALWSWIFFGLHRIGLALGNIAALWAAIVVTCVLFWRVRALAGALFVPYLGWVTFAGVLNYAMWRLNR